MQHFPRLKDEFPSVWQPLIHIEHQFESFGKVMDILDYVVVLFNVLHKFEVQKIKFSEYGVDWVYIDIVFA